MSRPRTTFKTVIWLIEELKQDVADLEERLLSSVCPIPQGCYQTSNDLIRYCRKRIQRAERFRHDHHEKCAVWFFDWIAIWSRALGKDQIAQHENQLKDCGRAVKLALEIIKSLSIAYERQRLFQNTENGGLVGVADSGHERRREILQQDIQCQERLGRARRRTETRSYLRKMRRVNIDLAELRHLAWTILHPNSSTATFSSRSNPESQQNGGYPYHPQNHESGPPPHYPCARNPPIKVQISSQLPRVVPVSSSANSHGPLLYQSGPYPPAGAQNQSQFPMIVDLRERETGVLPMDTRGRHQLERPDDHTVSKHTKVYRRYPEAGIYTQQPSASIIENEPVQDHVSRRRKSTSVDRSRNSPAVSDHSNVMNEHQPHHPQPAEHDAAPPNPIIEPRESGRSRSRRHRRRSRSRKVDNNQVEYQSPARESSSTSRRNSPHRHTTYVDDWTMHPRPQATSSIHPQLSSSYILRQTERRKTTSRSNSVRSEDEQHTRRRSSKSRSSSQSHNHDDLEGTERGRRSLRSWQPSPISQSNEQQAEKSRRGSRSSSVNPEDEEHTRRRNSKSRSSSDTHEDYEQTERGGRSSRSRRSSSICHGNGEQTENSRRSSSSRSSYDSEAYVTTDSSRYTTSNRSMLREPNVNRATRPPISTPQRMTKRTSSESSRGDSGVFVSDTASYMSRSGSSNRNFVPESPMPRQSHILHSYPPSSRRFEA
ncbi:hypothetical protein F5882DRAFT_385138 [Hyaloscypha sp. PMI_1271]|nr:hypothetical protein F5882DRAFT_385138 [Hyaloscypha sp. PMI_1271]